MRPIIAIVGPTATGKTAVGALVARHVNGEIISADSMAVYRGMNIGTAKPTAEERDAVPFHLIDVADPDEPYNVALFREQAAAVLGEIERRGRRPLLVGGTGLYVRVLLEDYGLTAVSPHAPIRARLEEEASQHGTESLHVRLSEVDPVSAERIHHNDRVRIVRALEVYEATGQPISDQQRTDAERRRRRPAVKFALTAAREELNRRIDMRVDAMMERGLVSEVESLLSRGYGPKHPPLQSLGYKEIVAYLQGRLTLDAAIEEIKRNTRRFAKRQMTWFRRDTELMWIDVGVMSPEQVSNEILMRVPE